MATIRTTDGIREAMFSELDALRSGKSTPQKASAVSRLCAGIIAATRLDLEYQRFAKALTDESAGTPVVSQHVPPLKLMSKAA